MADPLPGDQTAKPPKQTATFGRITETANLSTSLRFGNAENQIYIRVVSQRYITIAPYALNTLLN